jgi:pimeloyl-ACP methyl ester carboxylesterase
MDYFRRHLCNYCANSHKVEVSGASHAVYVSRPKEVAAAIEEAATHAPVEELAM